VNARGTFMCSQICLPHLLKAENPHILTLAPPINLNPAWWAPHTGYTLAKMGMSFVTLGLAAEFKDRVGVNALWPRTVIATDALKMIAGAEPDRCRTPEILADAAYQILITPHRELSGQFILDEDFLRTRGVSDFSKYAVDASKPLLPDLFLDEAL
jgi:citronellol/citronellal dehydrogenase